MRGHLILQRPSTRAGRPGTDRATDWNPDPATDPAPEWDGRAWGATDRVSTLSHAIGLGAALDAFCVGKAAEGLSSRSIVWYRMIGERLVGRFGAERPVDALTLPELRAWLVELRATLSPTSVAGYLRGLRAFGNCLANDGMAVAHALRALANPRVPRRVIEPLSDAALRRLLAAAGERDGCAGGYRATGYIAERPLAVATFFALRLDRPLLLEGRGGGRQD